MCRCRRQIPVTQKVPVAKDDMGWRGDGVLFQGKEQDRLEGMLFEESLSDTGRQERPREKNRAHAHASLELVQES